jgi:hypothetical protein
VNRGDTQDHLSPKSCTIFTFSIGNNRFYGNNEDHEVLPENTFIALVPSQKIPKNWSHPGTKGMMEIYGFVLFGVIYDDLLISQGGMNEHGLCFDINGLPPVPFSGTQGLKWQPWFNRFDILWKNKTVSDVKQWFQTHEISERNWGGGQFHFADENGDAFVLSVGEDGNFAFTDKGDNKFLISTNFNVANKENGEYPCKRYEKAEKLLDRINDESDLSVAACRDVLDAVHFEKRGICETVYGNIFNLVTKDVHVYTSHKYDSVVSFNLLEELSYPKITVQQITNKLWSQDYYGYSGFRGIRVYSIPDLFVN